MDGLCFSTVSSPVRGPQSSPMETGEPRPATRPARPAILAPVPQPATAPQATALIRPCLENRPVLLGVEFEILHPAKCDRIVSRFQGVRGQVGKVAATRRGLEAGMPRARQHPGRIRRRHNGRARLPARAAANSPAHAAGVSLSRFGADVNRGGLLASMRPGHKAPETRPASSPRRGELSSFNEAGAQGPGERQRPPPKG